MFFAASTFDPPSGSGRVHWAFTDALGDAADAGLTPAAGAADAPTAYGRFNLGAHVGDDPAAVGASRELLVEAFRVVPRGVVYMNQVHGRDVAVVESPWPGEIPPCDGIVTATPGLGVAVLVADCVPVLLADPETGVVGAAHAGRKGMTAGVVTATAERMRELGAHRIQAVVGPSICGRCYEVPEAMRSEAAAVRSVSASVTWRGTPSIDVAAGVVDELSQAGIEVTWLPGCTLENPALYSYRRNPRTGRLAGVVAVESSVEGAAGDGGAA